MGLYNFKEQFEPHILSGRKRHTIRAKRKHPDKPGDPFYGYTGLRTKKARKLIESKVLRVDDIKIEMRPSGGIGVLTRGLIFPHVIIDGNDLSGDEKEALAYADGFHSFADMMKFWKGRLPFSGDLIHFDYEKAKFLAKPRKAA